MALPTRRHMLACAKTRLGCLRISIAIRWIASPTTGLEAELSACTAIIHVAAKYQTALGHTGMSATNVMGPA